MLLILVYIEILALAYGVPETSPFKTREHPIAAFPAAREHPIASYPAARSLADEYDDGQEQNIINGETAKRGEYPYTVRLLLNGFSICTGSILDQTTVLTAAHCVDNADDFKNGNIVEALAGDWIYSKYDGTEQFSAVTGYVIHPRYGYENFTSEGSFMTPDVAVLKVETPFVFNDYVGPVKLARTRDWERRVRRQKNCYAAGYGLISVDPRILPSKLQATKVEIFGRAQCDSWYETERWTANVICGYNPPQSTCSGDSGGPLVCKTKQGTHVQIGFTSFGNCAGFTGYARVYSNIDWILRQKRKSSLPLGTFTQHN